MDSTTTHNIGTIFPVTNQHILLHHQYNNIINSPSADIFISSSSSTTFNSIDIKEVAHINFRKRIKHPLCYPKYCRPLKFSSPPNHHGINNHSNESEQHYNQFLLSQNFTNAITHISSPPYPSTIYIIQNNNHNKQIIEDDQNFTTLNLNYNSQSLPIPYSKKIIPKITERICKHPKHKNKFQLVKHQNNTWSSSVISKYFPLYPGIPASTTSSRSSSTNSVSTYNSSQTYNPPSKSTTNNSESSLSIIESHPSSPPSIIPSLKPMELNTMNNIMLCLTTNSSDEDTTFDPNQKWTILPICPHLKSPITITQNTKIQLTSPHPQTPIHLQTASPLQTEKVTTHI